MAGISGINFSSYGNNRYNIGFPININTSTERFKGGVTGYKPVNSNQSQSGLAASAAKSYLSAIKEFGNKLRSATANAAQEGQSIFKSLLGVSSNNDAMSVSVSNQTHASYFNDAKNQKNVAIQQLATTQQNTGVFMGAYSINGAKTGTNLFSIEKGGKSYDFSVNVNATDSVYTVQQKTANAINKQNMGVTASVRYNKETKESSLFLTSNDTGEKNAFTVADEEGYGSLIASLGAGNQTQEARDALYTVDGEEKSSDKNTVDLGSGLTGTLKKAGPDEIKATVDKDVAGIESAVNDMVEQFNGLLETAKSYNSDRNAGYLQDRLETIASSYSSSLRNIGIASNEDGYLEVDAKKMQAAFENGQAERYLGNDSFGFTQRLSQVAAQADTDPNQFLSYQSRNNMNDGDNGNRTNGGFDIYKYLSSGRNAQWYYSSLLLNMGV